MRDFDHVYYTTGHHSVDRYIERVAPNCPRTLAEREIIFACQKGEILKDTEKHRYIRNGNLFIPCLKMKKDWCVAKTVLTWDMVEHDPEGYMQGYDEEVEMD